MGGNLQKGRKFNQNEKNKDQLISVSDTDFKELANLGEFRWFYCSEITRWGHYNSLSEEEKSNTFWNIFPQSILYISSTFLNKVILDFNLTSSNPITSCISASFKSNKA